MKFGAQQQSAQESQREPRPLALQIDNGLFDEIERKDHYQQGNGRKFKKLISPLEIPELEAHS
jgi:hypothetical protein